MRKNLKSVMKSISHAKVITPLNQIQIMETM